MVDLVELSDAEFDDMVLQADHAILVQFGAPWCGPCIRLEPILKKVAYDMAEKMQVMTLNTDENQLLPRKLNVMSIPTLILFENGGEVQRFVGVMSEAKLKKRLLEALGR